MDKASDSLSLLVWVATGEVDYVAALNMENDPDNESELVTTLTGTLDSSNATAPRVGTTQPGSTGTRQPQRNDLMDQDGSAYSVIVMDGNSPLESSSAVLTVVPLITGPVSIETIATVTLDSAKDTAPSWVRLDFEPLVQDNHTIHFSWDNSASSDVKFRV